MIIKTISVSTSYKVLNEVTSKLNGANKHPTLTLKGMFIRRQDFESSTKQVMQELSKERLLALKLLQRTYDNDTFRNEAEKCGVRLHSHSMSNTGNRGFDTYDLSPAVRHFLNDYCRVLEPLVKLLAQKHPSVSAQNTRKPTETVSFNAYLKRLDTHGISTPLDHTYFIKMYDELWNDYKHAESSGVQAGAWVCDSETILSEPKLYGGTLVYFKGMTVKDFVDKSLNNMNLLLNYIA